MSSDTISNVEPQTFVQPDAAQAKPARLEFTGSGSEYFRIWAVNLVLIVCTFGIYSAWAKVRREKYFHQHTRVDGIGLEYHGQPIPILKGRAIALVALYLSQMPFLPSFVMIGALLVLVLAFPFLMQQSLRFRMFNTSHRGLRFGFDGTREHAYQIAKPVLIVIAAALALYLINDWYLSSEIIAGIGGITILPLAVGLYAYVIGLWKVFAFTNARYGSVRTKVNFTARDYTMLLAKQSLVFVAIIVLAFFAIGLFGGFSVFSKAIGVGALFIATAPLLIYVVVIAAVGYVYAKIHHFVWGGKIRLTFQPESGHAPMEVANFETDLSISQFCWLQIKNTLLTLVTFGLYRPFAAVASAKMRLESVTLTDTRFIELVAAGSGQQKNAFGEAALEAIDLDFSL